MYIAMIQHNSGEDSFFLAETKELRDEELYDYVKKYWCDLDFTELEYPSKPDDFKNIWDAINFYFEYVENKYIYLSDDIKPYTGTSEEE